jgi:hypothetical protein
MYFWLPATKVSQGYLPQDIAASISETAADGPVTQVKRYVDIFRRSKYDLSRIHLVRAIVLETNVRMSHIWHHV